MKYQKLVDVMNEPKFDRDETDNANRLVANGNMVTATNQRSISRTGPQSSGVHLASVNPGIAMAEVQQAAIDDSAAPLDEENQFVPFSDK